WMVVNGTKVASARNSSLYRYDEHGRTKAIIRPGDTDTAPTITVAYELADPASRIVVTSRSKKTGAPDIEEVQCQDGRGRTFQTRRKIADGSDQASGFSAFNRLGKPVKEYQAYQGNTGACDKAAPASGVLFAQYQYDALDRPVQITEPDKSVRRTE